MPAPPAPDASDPLDVLHDVFGRGSRCDLDGASLTCARSGEDCELVLRALARVEASARGYAAARGGVSWDGGAVGKRVAFLGFQACEFARPVRCVGGRFAFDFFDRAGFVRPRSVLPLIAMREDGGVVLLAPLGGLHEQVLGVDGGRLAWGWSGDLEVVEEGFEARLGVYRGRSVRVVLERWGAAVRARLGGGVGEEVGADVGADVGAGVALSALSLWTDNGAAYWYRTEAGLSLPETLARTVGALDTAGVPVRAVELDSWFYPHRTARRVADVGYPSVVPPTGMLLWEPREDVLGPGGVAGLRARLGARPLILHSRHIAAESPYVTEAFGAAGPGKKTTTEERGWWVDGDRAHPVGTALFDRWMRQARDWGAVAYEQDWLVEIWQGVRQLRARPGRIAAWQRTLHDAARRNGLSLIWCMATPADMVHAVALPGVAAVRSCDDYRYAADPSVLWRWHLTTCALLRALRLTPFKDVFFSSADAPGGPSCIDGDPNAALEAALSALSAGPVGIGDRLGRTDKPVVMCTCRADGELVKPDVPLAALDRTLRSDVHGGGSCLLWADTHSAAAHWRYVLCAHAGTREDAEQHGDPVVREMLDVCEGGQDVLVYDWNARAAAVAREVSVALKTHQWMLWVVVPVAEEGRMTLIGDVGVYATMGARRMRVREGADMRVEVLGCPGEVVSVGAWSRALGLRVKEVAVPPKAWVGLDLDEDSWRDSSVGVDAQ